MAGLRRCLGRAAPALVGYAVVRGFGLMVLVAWALLAGEDPYRLLADRWDAVWYVSIGEHGYGRTVQVGVGQIRSDLAFFPLFPALTRVVSHLSPLDVMASGLAVSGLAAFAAAWGIFAVGDLLYGRRTGTILAIIWGTLPGAVVEQMAYTESLFTALAAWALYALQTRHWISSGTLALAAGLTRPTAAAVVAAVWVGAALAIRQDWRGAPGLRRMRTRTLVAALLAPLGLACYLLWVAMQTGRVDGYLEVQRQWIKSMDAGQALLKQIIGLMTGPAPLAGVAVLAGLMVALLLLGLCVRQHQPLPLVVFTGVLLLFAVTGTGYFNSRPRLLLPAFGLLLPVAAAVAKARPAVAVAVLSLLATSSATYGVYMLLFAQAPP